LRFGQAICLRIGGVTQFAKCECLFEQCTLTSDQLFQSCGTALSRTAWGLQDLVFPLKRSDVNES
jgi:hypothetical protein